MSTEDGIFNVITGGNKMPKSYLTNGYTVKKDSSGYYMSVCGNLTDLSNNSNKGYAIQVLLDGAGDEYLVCTYGRIGGTTSEMKYKLDSNATTSFHEKVYEKFGRQVFEGMNSNTTIMEHLMKTQPVNTLKTKYGIYFCEVITPVAKQVVTPGVISTICPYCSPEVAELFSYILSPVQIHSSLKKNVSTYKLNFEVSSIPSLRSIQEAKQAHVAGMNSFSGTQDMELIAKNYEIILSKIPHSTGRYSAYTSVRNGSTDLENWKQIGALLDAMEDALISLNLVSNSVSPSVTSPTGQTNAQIANSRVFKGESAGLYAASGINSHDSLAIKLNAISTIQNPILEAYAKLRANIVHGNATDYAICNHFVKRSNRFTKFKCFAVSPYSNESKNAAFAGARSMLLVHGTMLPSVAAISGSELDVKRSSGGRLGKRIYLADDIKKSMQYSNGYFFIVQCKIPDTIIETRSDLSWNRVHPNNDDMIYADGYLSLRVFDETYGGKPNSVSLSTLTGISDGDYFQDRSSKILLPGHSRTYTTPLSSSFDFAEYTLGDNKNAIIRYVIYAQ